MSEMNSEKSPGRVYVYPAREAPIAVVLRRGPSEWTRMSVWRMDTDTFEHGQWLHARVYERRCDVSPDGSLFAYFTLKVAGGPDIDTDSWIAVSRPPYFTALAMWGVGMTYCAGAYFVDDRTLFASWIEDAPDVGELPPWMRLTKDLPHAFRTTEWTDRIVFTNRLLAAGWRTSAPLDDLKAWWEHPSPDGARVLTMLPIPDIWFDNYGGRHVEEYAFTDRDGGMVPLGRATWADWDQRGRLLLAQDGRIVEWVEPGETRVIEDFNDQRPDPQPPPAWAREWPKQPLVR